MATEVIETEEIQLADGTVVELRPLNIKSLRKFMKVWTAFVQEMRDNADRDDEDKDKVTDDEMNDKQFDVFMELCALGLKKILEKAGKSFDKDEDLVEYLEDTLDEPTMYHVMDKTGGLKLNDPNLQAAAMLAAAQDGTN